MRLFSTLPTGTTAAAGSTDTAGCRKMVGKDTAGVL